MEDKYIPMKEALHILGVSRRTLYNLEKDGKIIVKRPNSRRLYVSLNSIVKHISGQTT